MKKIWFAALAVVCFASPVWAGPMCYSPAEMQAEHLLRLHSELMVITVTCHVGSQGQDLVSAYTGFTKRNINELHGAEKVMANYYDNNGGHGQDRLDKLRTILANEFGQKIVTMGTAQAFCDAYRDKVLTFASATPADVQNEIERMQVTYKAYADPCAAATRMAKKEGGN
jgi:hypothetical protein